MQRTKPKLKVDRIFGPELVPQRRGFPVSAWLLVLLCAGGIAALYQYATPIWLCYRLEQNLKQAKTADEVGIAAENLLALGDDGLKVVVASLADPRIEISAVAYQVLKSRLDDLTTEELLESEWVSSLAGNLRKSAADWQGESKRFGCQLASAIYTAYETQGDPERSDRVRWAAARLDTWAVLENHQWANSVEPLRSIASPADMQPAKPVALLGASENGSSGVLASSILSSGGGALRAIEYQGPEVNSRTSVGNGAVSGSSDRSDSASSSSAVGSSATDMGLAVKDSAGEVGGVRFGDLKQAEAGEEPMARIQVIPKNRLAGTSALSNAPRGVSDAEANRWEEKIQRIDTRSAELDVALRQKDVLELFMLLKSENIAEQAAAVRELDERGLSDVEIALATNLVRGNSAARIKLLSDLPRMEIADPSRWYIWMAQNEDREVRRSAILGLGSVADPGIASMIRELRVHETDRELKDLLQTILKNIER